MARIGVYGGSFNPPHKGHILAAREFQRALKLDELLLIPAAIPPHKVLPDGSPNGETRMRMLELAAEELPFARIDDLELRREGPSYTVDTLQTLHDRYPNDELFLCVGTDMFLSFDSWYQPGRICELATIAMAHRADCDEEELQALAQSFGRRFGVQPALIRNEFVEVSSSQVRRLLIFGAAEEFLPASVLAYITQHGLYGVGLDRHDLSFEELRKESLSLHKQSRVRHVIGCSQTAGELAEHYGENVEDARRAGILHDVTKALSGRDQLRLCDRYGIIIDDFERAHPKILHAVTAAKVAERIFGENDAVCSAIRWHTTGKADMTTLEKIIYVADYMEPNRDFPGVERLRRLAFTDLDEAMLLGLQMAKEHLDRQGAIMGRYSVEAMDFLENRKGTCVKA